MATLRCAFLGDCGGAAAARRLLNLTGWNMTKAIETKGLILLENWRVDYRTLRASENSILRAVRLGRISALETLEKRKQTGKTATRPEMFAR